MKYSIDTAAEELMLEPAEVKEILAIFFEDAPEIFMQGQAALAEQNFYKLARCMHSLKGAAFNMRMNSLGELADQAERCENLPIEKLQLIMNAIDTELREVKTVFEKYCSN